MKDANNANQLIQLLKDYGRRIACELCGVEDRRVLCVHHLVSANDDRPRQLMVLCFNCHSIVHHSLRHGYFDLKYSEGEREVVEVFKEQGLFLKKMYGTSVCFNCLIGWQPLRVMLEGDLKNCFVCLNCFEKLMEEYFQRIKVNV